MSKFIVLFGVLIHSAGLATETNGWCQFDYTTPEMPTANCEVPKCPTGADCECPGGDCTAPTIGKGNVAFQEPVMLWSEKCVLNGKRTPCYEITSPFQFSLEATDASGIAEIGFEVAVDTEERRHFIAVWGPARKSATSRLELHSNLKISSRPGQKVSYSILKICARDKEGNRGCQLVR